MSPESVPPTKTRLLDGLFLYVDFLYVDRDIPFVPDRALFVTHVEKRRALDAFLNGSSERNRKQIPLIAFVAQNLDLLSIVVALECPLGISQFLIFFQHVRHKLRVGTTDPDLRFLEPRSNSPKRFTDLGIVFHADGIDAGPFQELLQEYGF